MTEEEISDLKRLNGLYVGQLTNKETDLLYKAIGEHKARQVWKGPSGFFLGLSKVEVL